ncbi:acyl-homoserine-lactone synthase [Tardiphaga sp. 709]|uniref:acyl-homoserine-lactone synthase n=1 Tax=Tardiphaga sp. 709 TaxID=3076039 RepID=UPI0028E404F1|nr:acyl-homoserine-lactone synthase [Tardiphaga sp. 709]WNV11691.1 acyl-homoserine-lactone synthase [Tardiphaga sp. 709]
MIRVIDQSNSAMFAPTLDQVFKLRHACFVKERGWQEFEKDGIYEQDQYDDDHAIYLASLDDQHDVIGCLRLYPTALPHMLSEQFAYLVDGPVPSSEQVIEMTRLAIKPGRRGGETYHELLIGVQEFCIARDILNVTAVVRALRMSLVQKMGYQLNPLGSVHQIDGDATIAVMFDTSEPALNKIRARTGVTHSVMEDTRVPMIRKSA